MESEFPYLVDRFVREERVVESVSEQEGMLNIGFGQREDLDGDWDNILLAIETAQAFGIVGRVKEGTRLVIERDNYEEGRISNVEIVE